MIRLTYERRQQLIDACVGAAMVALTVVLAAALLWLAVAVVVGSAAMGRWVAGVVG
jgi:hypothetical protein